MQVAIHIDGGSRGNPGPAAAGVVIADADSGKLIHEAGYRLGEVTNNVAEYLGLIRAVQIALEAGATTAVVHSDSQLLVRQMRGLYRVRSADLRPLFDQAQELLGRLDDWRIEHVTREDNYRADELVNQALDTDRDVVFRHAGSASPPSNGGVDTPTVRCAVRFARMPDRRCPCHGAMHGEVYDFGPATPEGLCVHAARAVLASGLFDGQSTGQATQVPCPRCGVAIQIVPISES